MICKYASRIYVNSLIALYTGSAFELIFYPFRDCTLVMWKSPSIADRVTDLDDYTVVVTVSVCVIGEVDGFPHKASLNNFNYTLLDFIYTCVNPMHN